MKVLEVTTSNKDKYLHKIAELEKIVLDKMNNEGKIGQLFITGYSDIEKYIDSKDNSVFCIVDDYDNVLSATYITQGQIPFTYNDITKYFKYDSSYLDYIKENKFNGDDNLFREAITKTYKIKLEAYNYTKDKLLKDSKYFCLTDWLCDELSEDENNFHEKSELREKFNVYMYEYVSKYYPNMIDYYKWFYHLDSTYTNISNNDTLEYDNMLKYLGYTIYESSSFKKEDYYDAFPNNSIEIDTYLTNPNNRASGLSRIIVFEGIRKHILNFFLNTSDDLLYLCSTLHRDNISSKYVSEFFLLEDNLYLNRRFARDREVHIYKIDRKNYQEYLKLISAKLAIYYDYNPDNINYDLDYLKHVESLEEAYYNKEIAKCNNDDIRRRFARVRSNL